MNNGKNTFWNVRTSLKRFTGFIATLALVVQASAQSLMEPISSAGVLWFPVHHECIITDIDDKVIKGKIVSGASVGTSPKWITVKDDAGEKIKMDASRIKTMKVKASDLIKYEKAMASTGSVSQAANANWEDIVESEYLVL